MTLRSEIYFCILKSSSMLGRGVSASARGLSMSTLMLKDSKGREEVRARKEKLHAMTHA